MARSASRSVPSRTVKRDAVKPRSPKRDAVKPSSQTVKRDAVKPRSRNAKGTVVKSDQGRIANAVKHRSKKAIAATHRSQKATAVKHCSLGKVKGKGKGKVSKYTIQSKNRTAKERRDETKRKKTRATEAATLAQAALNANRDLSCHAVALESDVNKLREELRASKCNAANLEELLNSALNEISLLKSSRDLDTDNDVRR